MNLSNYETPISYYFNSVRYTYLNPDLGQRRLRSTKRTLIYDWRGFLSQPFLNKQFDAIDTDSYDVMYRDSTQVSCLPSEILTPNCRPYWMVDTMSGGLTISITRSYTGLLDTLSNIGVFTRWLSFVSSCFTSSTIVAPCECSWCEISST